MALTRSVIFGAAWLVAARLATKSLDLISMLIMARLLLPADFGLIALAASVLLILTAVTDLSLDNILIQMKDPTKSAYDTAFTLSFLRGLGLTLAIWMIAWPFAHLYSDQRLFLILCVLALTPLIQGLRSPRMAHFQRELQFHQSFYVDIFAKVASTMASIIAALVTGSYWAIIVGMVCYPFISSILSYRVAPFNPRFDLRHARGMFSFSSWIALANVVNSLNYQADKFFIGGKLGASQLGFYTVGSDLAALPTNTPLIPIMQSLYAGFAKVSSDITRLKTAYLTSQCVLLAIALPIATAVAVLAKPILLMALGPTWLPAVIVVQILAPVFAAQTLTAPAQSVAMVLGQTKGLFVRDLISLVVRLPLIMVALLLGGLHAVVWARVCSGLFIISLNLMMTKKLLNLSLIGQLCAPWRSLASSILMAVTMYALSDYFVLSQQTDWKAAPLIICTGLVGLVCYVGIHLALWQACRRPPGIEERLMNGFLKFSKRKKPAS